MFATAETVALDAFNKLSIADRFKVLSREIQTFPDIEGCDITLELGCALNAVEKAWTEYENRELVF